MVSTSGNTATDSTSKGLEYLQQLSSLLDRVAMEQAETISSVAKVMAETISRQGLVHLFGSAHSMLPVLEIFPRYGSFVGLHPLIDPRLLWFNVLGSGGVPEMLFLQNTEAYAPVFLDGQHLHKGDMMIIFSHGGTSAVAVDTALYAKALEMPVVAILSLNACEAASPRHSSGKKLTDLADYILDTGVPQGDGLIAIGRLPERVGAGSTVVATSIGLALVVACAEQLVAAAYPLVQSVRTDENEHQAYRTLYQAYEASLRPPNT